MASFDHWLEKDIAAYEGRHDDIIFQAPAMYRLLTRILDDPRLPGRMRPIVIASIAYFVLPYDVMPEETYGPYGYIDDIFLCALVAERIRQEIGSQEILTSNWDGEGDIISLIGSVLANEKALIGNNREKILQYLGYEYMDDIGLMKMDKS
ncbi:Uncharacterised protein [uncultured archaeon]|nr:Uncharacterised protein [uncultured archaeon]